MNVLHASRGRGRCCLTLTSAGKKIPANIFTAGIRDISFSHPNVTSTSCSRRRNYPAPTTASVCIRRYENVRPRSPRATLSTGTAVSREMSPLPPDFPLVQFSRTSGFALCGMDRGEGEHSSAAYVTVIPDMISAKEEQALMRDLEPVFARKRYERGHWDSVIDDYKESERFDGSWSPRSRQIVDDIRSYLMQSQAGLDTGGESAPWLPVHAIDLSSHGFIRPHVDSVKFSGGLVAGLSLVSSAIMQLTRAADSDLVDLLLPPRSLYILHGPARFEWAHAILPSDGEPIYWHGRYFPRGRRVSLIFRDELVGPAPEPHPGAVAATSGANSTI